MKRILPLFFFFALIVQSCSISKNSSKEATSARAAATSRSGVAGADRNQVYATQFGAAAILEMERDGIPASITLAQGILESGAGTSELAQNANNHFGIKCGSGWSGKSYQKQDDDKDANGNPVQSCFRKYNKVEDSFHDHGEFLRDPKKELRYGFLFKLDRTDYKGWAEGLEAAGYSTSPTYSEKLVDIIERYKLYEYDTPGSSAGTTVPNPENPNAGGSTGAQIPLPNPANRIGRINDTKVVLAREGETITDIAKAYRLNANNVANYNDRGYTPAQKLKANTRVFIQQKRDKWSGQAKEHFVKENETMFSISQLYGVKLEKLLDRNRLNPGQEPAVGERIRLKGKRPAGDNVRLRESGVDPTPNQPDVPATTPPTEGSLEPDDSGYLEPPGGEQPAPANPDNMKPPAVIGIPYPSDPIPNQPNQPGQPDTGVTPKPTTPANPPPVAADGYHIVVKGDTLYSIARAHNTTVARIKQLNNLKDDTVKIGQTLRVR